MLLRYFLMMFVLTAAAASSAQEIDLSPISEPEEEFSLFDDGDAVDGEFDWTPHIKATEDITIRLLNEAGFGTLLDLRRAPKCQDLHHVNNLVLLDTASRAVRICSGVSIALSHIQELDEKARLQNLQLDQAWENITAANQRADRLQVTAIDRRNKMIVAQRENEALKGQVADLTRTINQLRTNNPTPAPVNPNPVVIPTPQPQSVRLRSRHEPACRGRGYYIQNDNPYPVRATVRKSRDNGPWYATSYNVSAGAIQTVGCVHLNPIGTMRYKWVGFDRL